jgi:hypothetical protein
MWSLIILHVQPDLPVVPGIVAVNMDLSISAAFRIESSPLRSALLRPLGIARQG